jgi:hypothetical protein
LLAPQPDCAGVVAATEKLVGADHASAADADKPPVAIEPDPSPAATPGGQAAILREAKSQGVVIGE